MEKLVIIILALVLNELVKDEHKYKGGLFNYFMLEDELKERKRLRETQGEHSYPMQDDYTGRIRKKGLDQCETSKDECLHPIWGKYNDKHKGEFFEGLTSTGFRCECNW